MQDTELQSYNQFLLEIEGKKKIEEKIRVCLDFMKNALSQEQMPAFRDFWQAKQLCLNFFKEKLSSRIRTIFWKEYIELSEEMRQLKEIFQEESSFAKEQIALAIQGVEEDLDKKPFLLDEIEEIKVPQSIQKNAEKYIAIQQELELFNIFAGRLNSLRKELISFSLPMKEKNEFFKKISDIGDQIFPRRKELICELSSLFHEDISHFIQQEIVPPFYPQKEEIKTFQNFAKVLTLSTESFIEVRQKLSEYWEQIKEQEKKENQKKIEKRHFHRVNFEKLDEKVTLLEKEYEEKTISLPQIEEKVQELFKEINESELGFKEGKILKKRLIDIKKLLEEKLQKEKEWEAQASILEQKKQEQVQKQLLHRLQDVLNQADVLALDLLVEKWETLVKEEKALSAKGIEKEMLDNRLDALFDSIQEKKWQNLLEENLEDLSSSLYPLLDERHKAKRKIKENLESHRKAVGGSGLTLEESMLYQELIAEEKLRLDSIETMIEEIEEKLFDLQE